MKHKAIGIIPARGGSKRIPNKNIIDLAGKPLIAYSIFSAKRSKFLTDRIFVSTEDKKIAKTAQRYKAQVIDRPKELATDKSETLPVLKHAVAALEKNGLDFDTVVLLQPTSPFRKAETIDLGIKRLWDNWNKLGAIFSVRQTKFPPKWLLEIASDKLKFIFPNNFKQIRGQDLEKTYEIDGCLYVFKKDSLKRAKNYPFFKNKTGYIIPSKIESIDIDDMEDLEIARKLLSK